MGDLKARANFVIQYTRDVGSHRNTLREWLALVYAGIFRPRQTRLSVRRVVPRIALGLVAMF